MKQRKIGAWKKRLAGCMAFLLVFSAFLPTTVYAATKPKLAQTKVTLKEGNTFQIELENYSYYEWMGLTYTSSAPKIASVDKNGLVTAHAKGTATISVSTTRYSDQEKLSLKCKVTVKSNGLSISSSELTVYKGEFAELSLSGSKKGKGYDADVYRAATWEKLSRSATDYNQEENLSVYYYNSYGLNIRHYSDGKFKVIAHESGDYQIELVMDTGDGKRYSKYCTLHVLPLGLEKSAVTVAVGKTLALEVFNATNVTFESEAPEIVRVDSDGKLTGLAEGETYIDVSYQDPFGETQKDYGRVYVSNPGYVPLEGSLPVGMFVLVNLTGLNHSSVTVESSDPEVLTVSSKGFFSEDKYYYAQKVGTATVTFEVDGVKFQQEIKTIDPALSKEQMLLIKGKSDKIAVEGIDKGATVTYTSSHPSIVSVTKNGSVKAKKAGAALITVEVNGKSFYCPVTVLAKATKGAKAVLEGEKVLGAAYSQEKRMQKGYYDCSSFVWRMYKAIGVKLGGFSTAPTAAELAKKLESQGKAISYGPLDPSELKPGDLIFYAGYNENGRYKNIDHVAMYYGSYMYYSSWMGGWYDSGLIIHSSPPSVYTKDYNMHRIEDIVLIVRPY